MQNQWEPQACFSAMRRSHLMGDSATRSVFLMSSVLRNFVLVAVSAEQR